MEIRRARDADAGALARIFHDAVRIGAASVYTEAQRQAWSPRCRTVEESRARLDGCVTFVAADPEPVGFLAMEGGHLDMLFVRPEQMGQGTAGLLYDAALDHARAAGLTRLTVDAGYFSQRFLARRGWRVIGVLAHLPGAGRVVNALMALDLPPG